jgi:hypothetical protein
LTVRGVLTGIGVSVVAEVKPDAAVDLPIISTIVLIPRPRGGG